MCGWFRCGVGKPHTFMNVDRIRQILKKKMEIPHVEFHSRRMIESVYFLFLVANRMWMYPDWQQSGIWKHQHLFQMKEGKCMSFSISPTFLGFPNTGIYFREITPNLLHDLIYFRLWEAGAGVSNTERTQLPKEFYYSDPAVSVENVPPAAICLRPLINYIKKIALKVSEKQKKKKNC